VKSVSELSGAEGLIQVSQQQIEAASVVTAAPAAEETTGMCLLLTVLLAIFSCQVVLIKPVAGACLFDSLMFV